MIITPISRAFTWTIETVDSAGKTGAWSSIVLDSSDNPHISYYDITNGDLKYTLKSGGIWDTSTIDSSGDVGLFTSLVRDSSGTFRVIYQDLETTGDLNSATNTSNTLLSYIRNVWAQELVDHPGNALVGEDSSLALDSSDNPHISYYDATYGDLKYAYASAPTPIQNESLPDDVNYSAIIMTAILTIAVVMFIVRRRPQK